MLSQACLWLSRGVLPLPKQNIFLFKPQTTVDYGYAIFRLFFLLLYSLPLFQLGLSHPQWLLNARRHAWGWGSEGPVTAQPTQDLGCAVI